MFPMFDNQSAHYCGAYIVPYKMNQMLSNSHNSEYLTGLKDNQVVAGSVLYNYEVKRQLVGPNMSMNCLTTEPVAHRSLPVSMHHIWD